MKITVAAAGRSTQTKQGVFVSRRTCQKRRRSRAIREREAHSTAVMAQWTAHVQHAQWVYERRARRLALDDFYPFVENGPRNGAPAKGTPAEGAGETSGQQAADGAPALSAPIYPARIAVYDDMEMSPRVVVVDPKDIRDYLAEITSTTYELVTQQGGTFAFSMIRELVENYIHAAFIEPTISILDRGQTIVFSDQGPGIPNKRDAMRPSFTSATRAMKKYIRGVGSGLPIVEEYIRRNHGTLTIEDNLGHGTIVTVSLVPKDAAANGHGASAGTTNAAGQGSNAGGALTAIPTMSPTPASYPAYGMSPQTAVGWPQNAYPAPAATGMPYGAATPGAPIQGGQQGTPTQGYPYPGQGSAPWGAGAAGPGLPGQAAAQSAFAYPSPEQRGIAPQGMPGWQVPAMPAYGYVSPYPTGAPYPTSAAYQTISPGQAIGHAGVQNAGAGESPTGMAANPVAIDVLPGPSPENAQFAATGLPGGAAGARLTEEQLSILSLFATHPEVGPKEIHDAFGTPNATGTRRLQKLETTGVIVKRGQKYQLTDMGRHIVSQMAPHENRDR